MRLHLPFSLRKSVLSSLVSMVALSLGSGSACAVTGPEPQNLVFDGETLTWNTNTENKAFTNAAGESASFATGDNVTFASDATASLGEDISAGQINIASGADVVIELADNGLNFDTLSMLGGSLDAGDSLNIAAGETLAVGSNGSVLKSDLVLEKNAGLSVDYAGTGSATSLNNSALSLLGGTRLQLSGCGNGDGKTYILLTGVSELKDAQGNAISLNSTNNAIAKYFDTSQPGTGFWADATLQLSADGILRLVRHSEAVKAAVTISTRQPGSVDYQYYEGVHFADIEYTSGSSYDTLGGAIYGDTITLSNNGSVVFEGNTASSSSSSSSSSDAYAYAYGGAIYGYGDSITLSNNGSVVFEGNKASSSSSSSSSSSAAASADAYGGAISGEQYSTITLSDNGSVTFSGNMASASSSAEGGAIYGRGDSTITLSNNGSVVFEGNTVSASYHYSSFAYGGAIYGMWDSTITLSDNGSVSFSGNTASTTDSTGEAAGGAIYGDSTITLSDNGSVSFIGNTASATSYAATIGGAIYGDSTITLSDNGSVTFCGNTASTSYHIAAGGAIYGEQYSTITLSDNGSVTFSGNTASSSDVYAYGGAISGEQYSTITLSNNGSVSFSGNTASATYFTGGGAIYGEQYSTITLSNNGSVTFSGNTSSDYGGAIYGEQYSTITLSDNGSVTFSGNTASTSDANAYGGAIYASGNLSIRNNGSVLFEKNVEKLRSGYRLRSIYAGGSGDAISLSAAVGKSIEFRDSVYIVSGVTVNLNQDYTYQAEDGTSFSIKQQGDIIFTGKYAETHLNEILAADEQGRTATTEEIRNSRTTVVNAMTNLYGGRLRVEEGAIYQGQGITAMEGSNATVRVKDAVLNHTGYELHFFEGTTLETLGESEIFGDVIVESTATAAFSALTRLEGSLTLASGSELSLDGALTLNGALNLGTSLTLSGDILGLVNQLQAGQSLTLMVGLDSLAVQSSEQLRSVAYTEVESGQSLQASTYFSNLDADSEFLLLYDGAAGSLCISSGKMIPEPATTTLSLLALAALMSRRRRK